MYGTVRRSRSVRFVGRYKLLARAHVKGDGPLPKDLSQTRVATGGDEVAVPCCYVDWERLVFSRAGVRPWLRANSGRDGVFCRPT